MFSGILSEIFLACVRPLHPEIAKGFGAREKAGSRRGPLPPELALWIMCRAQAISITSGGCKELLALAAWRLRAQCCPKQRRAGRGQTRRRRRRRRSTRRRRRNRTFKDPHLVDGGKICWARTLFEQPETDLTLRVGYDALQAPMECLAFMWIYLSQKFSFLLKLATRRIGLESSQRNDFLGVIHTNRHSILHIFCLFSGILSGILYLTWWHSILHLFLPFIGHSFWHFLWQPIWHAVLTFYLLLYLRMFSENLTVRPLIPVIKAQMGKKWMALISPVVSTVSTRIWKCQWWLGTKRWRRMKRKTLPMRPICWHRGSFNVTQQASQSSPSFCVLPLKRRVRSQLARWEMKNSTPLWREAHFEVKMYKTHHARTTFGRWDVEKVHAVVARSTFEVKMYKAHHARTTFGRRKKWTPLWREAHVEIKMLKTPGVRTTFGASDVEQVDAVVARSTFWSQHVKRTRGSDHFCRFRYRFVWQAQGVVHLFKSEQNVKIL